MQNLTTCMDFTQFLTQTYGKNNSNNHLHTEFVQTKFTMGTVCLDTYHHSFWQLIDHSV